MAQQNGKVISRPLHKFFNLWERLESQNLDLASYNFRALLKEDGAMIRPIPFLQSFRLATKGGISEEALLAEELISDSVEYHRLIMAFLDASMTPIFEICTPDRHIVEYPETKLVLLAARYNRSGVYLEYQQLQDIVQEIAPTVPLVKQYHTSASLADFVEEVKAIEGIEGVVLEHNGHRLKIKSDWFNLLHLAIDQAERISERILLRRITEGTIDDLKSFLVPSMLERVNEFESSFWKGILHSAQQAREAYAELEHLAGDRKAIAARISELKPKSLKAGVYAILSGQNPVEFYRDLVGSNLRNLDRIEQYRHIYGCEYKSPE